MAIEEFQGKYRFLSNFWPALIVYDGIAYPTVEHAYQAQKTTNEKLRQMVSEFKTPGEAKRWGSKVLLRNDWDNVKDRVMEDLVRLKFTTINDLKRKLVDTYNEELIEGNNWDDTYWGICRGNGQNKLGKILMQVRSEIMFAK
ncbi:MAG: NADAR family protein [Bacteroidota bacterium]|nr:NADAR family protein [Bacteroidota bacterium]